MKVSINPINEVKITHLFKTTKDNLTKCQAVTETPKLYWCNGILFSFYEFSEEKLQIELTKEIKEGIK